MIPYLVPNTFDLQRLLDSNGKFVIDSANKAVWVQNPSPSVPTNNSVGVLADAISCTTKHELNGQDELVMEYPITGALFDEIQLRAVIVANVEQRGNQPYRIYRITKPLDGVITVYARHLVYDLAGIVVEPYTANGIQAALSGLNSHAMVNNPFTFTTARTTASVFKVTVPQSIWALMGGQQGSLLDVYGGEYSWDGYTVTLSNSIGSNNGVSVRYGVNMTDLEQDAACDACYTGVVGYWQNEDTVVHSPVVSAIGTYGYVRILTVDFSDRWESAPTVDQLVTAAEYYITQNQIGVPKVSWKVSFVPLETTEEYKDIAALEQVNLGDTVGVKFEKLGVDASARVNSIEWDVLMGRYISVNLGSVKSNIADTMAKQSEQIQTLPTAEDVERIALFTAKRIVADEIAATTISADRISGGTLSLGREANVAGKIYVYNEANEMIGAVYNSGVWWGNDVFSSVQNQGGFKVRKEAAGVVRDIVFIGMKTPDGTGTDYGLIQCSSVDDSGNKTVNAYINGDGSLVCKRLFVNGHEIIPT